MALAMERGDPSGSGGALQGSVKCSLDFLQLDGFAVTLIRDARDPIRLKAQTLNGVVRFRVRRFW